MRQPPMGSSEMLYKLITFAFANTSSKAARTSAGPVLEVPRADEARTGGKEGLFGICVHRGGI